ncbi:MAG: hypothetical protein A2Z03_00180 [Chloroflexi bacterium RBG_16_56_8]|nr:MAG: hypothetical protein A2Z03_00180 [Chloroflexi bacterium RBG_16_56_8]
MVQRWVTPKFVIPGILFALAGLAVLWYLVSPLFINVRVSESVPMTAREVIAQEPAEMKAAME